MDTKPASANDHEKPIARLQRLDLDTFARSGHDDSAFRTLRLKIEGELKSNQAPSAASISALEDMIRNSNVLENTAETDKDGEIRQTASDVIAEISASLRGQVVGH